MWPVPLTATPNGLSNESGAGYVRVSTYRPAVSKIRTLLFLLLATYVWPEEPSSATLMGSLSRESEIVPVCCLAES